MTLLVADTTKRARLDAITSDWGANWKLSAWSGVIPTTLGATPAGAKLAEVTPTPAAAATASGVTSKDMLGGAKNTTGLAAGGAGTLATFYRVYKADGTTCVEQGTLATSGGDLNIDNTSIAQNQVVNFSTWLKTEP
jgi:hypothetical protein